MKVGDRVVVLAEDYKDITGVVTRLHTSGAVSVRLDSPTEKLELPFTAREIKLIEGE